MIGFVPVLQVAAELVADPALADELTGLGLESMISVDPADAIVVELPPEGSVVTELPS